ncbi:MULTISPECIES: phytoene/squalene synthase family protein [Kocuria]|uniref:phytoene/squalene synthase family protein n=1 Tax=Kocuria TaxID=57493 RepID=UPI000BF14EA0|nr:MULTISPECIES: phytoene/squalene synthase family protein [Kocuria]MBN6812574.1 phytoene/squalene synthase family protein [Kocuria indica]MBN6844267.1 phytoene/squalene synthase family protein [Kocuria indica]QIR70528.1 phytoene/squalene synthase family protein [Kocuria sp. KD4]GHD88363.1 phytoene synthase [Kocuria marina]
MPDSDAPPLSSLRLYTATALAASGSVIGRYSTSFSLACRTLPPAVRRDIAGIYALVRVADEVVDGTAGAAGLEAARVRTALDGYEAAVNSALATGFATDLVIHGFADVARRHGFGRELTEPFFASMRADLDVAEHDGASLESYIYGSAEVVGLMCLEVFMDMPGTRADTPEQRDMLRATARRLGAAFQKVNFLRDLGADHDQLGRTYFPGADPAHLDETQKAQLLADLNADLDAAMPGILALDRRARRAVLIAHGLFAELSRRIERVPARELTRQRISVPTAVKLRIAARSLSDSVVTR